MANQIEAWRQMQEQMKYEEMRHRAMQGMNPYNMGWDMAAEESKKEKKKASKPEHDELLLLVEED